MTEIDIHVNRRFPTRAVAVASLFSLGLLSAGLLLAETGTTADPDHDATFKLREVSVFSAGREDFLRGQMCRCQEQPDAAVLHYPVFKSKVPIYGSVKFAGRLNETNSAATYFFALDESLGTGKGYDLLYFDNNRDLDLRNDPVLQLNRHSPDHGYKPNFGGIKSVACFDFLKLSFPANSGGASQVELMPRLLQTGDETNTYRFLFFVRTHLFEGDIRMAGVRFQACLGNDYAVSPDLNSPITALQLSGPDGSFSWWGGDRITALHRVKGHYYSFTASQDGLVTVHPYSGDLGTFEAGPGNRALTNFTVEGSLMAVNWAVAVGGDIQAGACQIPAGDYLPEFLTVQFGHLRIQLSENYHSEGKRLSREGRPNVYGFTVRKARPYVLDFSNRPEVMFTSPTNAQRVKLGETISVMAVLTDPKLGFMIRHLDDTAHQQTKDAEGRNLGYSRNVSLDPKVIITRTNGEKVAEGVMPFG